MTCGARIGGAFRSGELHARQRDAGRGRAEPSRPGGGADGLVQARGGRRPARKIRHRPFPRTSDVQGNGRQPAGRLHGSDRTQRRARQRVHDPGLHRLSRDDRARPVGPRHAAGSGPHDRASARRQGRAARARCRPRGAADANRQRAGGIARGAAARHVVPSPSVPQSDDRLGKRNPHARHRRRAGFLSQMVRPQ